MRRCQGKLDQTVDQAHEWQTRNANRYRSACSVSPTRTQWKQAVFTLAQSRHWAIGSHIHKTLIYRGPVYMARSAREWDSRHMIAIASAWQRKLIWRAGRHQRTWHGLSGGQATHTARALSKCMECARLAVVTRGDNNKRAEPAFRLALAIMMIQLLASDRGSLSVGLDPTESIWSTRPIGRDHSLWSIELSTHIRARDQSGWLN